MTNQRQWPRRAWLSCSDKSGYRDPSPFGYAQGQDDGVWNLMVEGGFALSLGPPQQGSCGGSSLAAWVALRPSGFFGFAQNDTSKSG
jgi:hypothetical protein